MTLLLQLHSMGIMSIKCMCRRWLPYYATLCEALLTACLHHAMTAVVPSLCSVKVAPQRDIQKAVALSPQDALAAKAVFGLEPRVNT